MAIFVILPTLLSAQGQPKPKTFKLELPVSVKTDTAAFRVFIESPQGKRIKDVSKVTRIQNGATCPDCPTPYGRWQYEFEVFDDTEPTKLVTETICDGKTTVFNGEVLSKGSIRYDTIQATSGGKDTLVTYVLHVIPRLQKKVQEEICFGDTTTVNGRKIWETAVLYYTIPGTGTQCDVDVSHFVKILPQPQKTKRDSIYLGDTLTIKLDSLHQFKVWETQVLQYIIKGLNGHCGDTSVTHLITVLPKPKDNRWYVFAEQDAAYEPGRSPINNDGWTSTTIGVTTSPDGKWIFFAGIGWFPNIDFSIPTELDSLSENPGPDAGWNPCNCKRKEQVFSLHAKIAYTVQVKKLSLFGGTGGFRLSLGYDYAFTVPVDDVSRKEWSLPGALDLQAAVYWQRTVKGGGTVVAELGPTLQALNGSNHAGGQFRLRFVMPAGKK